MGKYCEMCGKKDKELSNPITHVHIDNYVDGDWYSSHKADLCQSCREIIFCCQDKIPSGFTSIQGEEKYK